MMTYVYIFLFTLFYFNLTNDLLTDFRQRERGRGREEKEKNREKERDLFHLLMHSLFASCIYPNQRSNQNLGIMGPCSN